MKSIVATLTICFLVGGGESVKAIANEGGGGGSRFYYDTLKIKALVSAPVLEEKLFYGNGGRTLDSIEMISIDDVQRDIVYRVRSEKCTVLAHLTWSNGDLDPGYKVVSVDKAICK